MEKEQRQLSAIVGRLLVWFRGTSSPSALVRLLREASTARSRADRRSVGSKQ